MVAGETLCRDGDPFTHFIFPQTGILSILSAVAGERAVEVLSVGREGFVGPAAIVIRARMRRRRRRVCAWQCHVCAAHQLSGGVCAVQLRAPIDDALRQVPGRGPHAGNRLREEQPCRSVDSAVAADRHGTDCRLRKIPVTHETLSNLLGLRRATITTALSKLAHEGIVKTERGTIRITDRDRLEPLGGEYYREMAQRI